MKKITSPAMLKNKQFLALAGLLLALFLPSISHAALFEDGEARRAILDLRERFELMQSTTTNELDQQRNAALELQNQINQLQSDLAVLRGEKEELLQSLQTYQSGMDNRLQKFEPTQIDYDGVVFDAYPQEKDMYEAALSLLRKGDFEKARDGFQQFLQQYPRSGYAASAKFWLGNAFYATKQYQLAIESFNAMLFNDSRHLRAPDAMLSITNCQIELKNVSDARKTLQILVKTYPDSEAAAEAKDRLTRLR